MSGQRDGKSSNHGYRAVEKLSDHPDRKVVGITTCDHKDLESMTIFLDVDEFVRRIDYLRNYLVTHFPHVDEQRLLIKIDEKGWGYFFYNPPPEQ